jgi:hypothetical protein
VADGTPLNWKPTVTGVPIDERLVYRRAYRWPITLKETDARNRLRILVVGALGLNPDRMTSFTERGHELHGLWMPGPHFWDSAGPPPFKGIRSLPPIGAGPPAWPSWPRTRSTLC